VHWTYEQDPFVDGGEDLKQGDILGTTAELRSAVAEVHPWFADEKYLGFVVLTQSCDLVQRPECRASHIALSPIRDLGSYLETLLGRECAKPIARMVFPRDRKGKARELLARVLNQNERAATLFYLHPDEEVGIVAPSVATLRVSFALRAQHYDTLKNARVGRLCKEFADKLGWLLGHSYSRIGTTDWPKRDLDKLVRDLLSEQGPAWVDAELAKRALDDGLALDGLSQSEADTALSQFEGETPIEVVARGVADCVKDVIDGITEEQLRRIQNRVKNNATVSGAIKQARRSG